MRLLRLASIVVIGLIAASQALGELGSLRRFALSNQTMCACSSNG
jgi:transposase